MTDQMQHEKEHRLETHRRWIMVHDFQIMLEYGGGTLEMGPYKLYFVRSAIPPIDTTGYQIIQTDTGEVIGDFGYNLAGALNKMVYLLCTLDDKYLPF